jgi:hypothetical protein
MPLALRQAAAWAAEAGVDFAEAAERIEDIIRATPPSNYPDPVIATVDLTLDRLRAAAEGADADAARRAGDALALLDLLPWLAPEGVDVKLVTDVATTEYQPTTLEGLDPRIRDMAQDAARVGRAVTALVRRSLAVAGEGTGPTRTVALHRLTAAVLRARALAGGAAERQAQAAAAAVAAGYPGGSRPPTDHRTWDDCRRLNPHVAALHALSARAEEPGTPATAAMDFLLNQASIFFRNRNDAETAVAYAEAALDLKIARLGADHPTVGIGRNALAGALIQARRWRSTP